MNGVELFLLGRTLMKVGEQAMPEPATGSRGSVRSVLVTLGEIVASPGTTVGEIATRTGLPQSQVSTAVARLVEAGSVLTEPDPADRRRRLVRPAAQPSARVAEVRATTVDDALAAALAGPGGAAPDPAVLHAVTEALATLARHLAPGRPVPSAG
ncbi:MarR family transcriptional regulator [Kitasatospora purpeofusca]|uniref:MarR family transcriptional regulator n=1 Tax=Kitasatospora purpeofusca TaxID=67352 RepID=UPI0004C0712A|nr:helix-turn-helix domain-containing protein [Kitasatospora purpeofusca]